MVEVFVFTEGEGILHLDDRNHSVRSGSFAIVYPRTRHTIYNLPEAAKPLTLLSMAVVR